MGETQAEFISLIVKKASSAEDYQSCVAVFAAVALDFFKLFKEYMASIKQRKAKDGKIHYDVQVRLKGHDHQHASFTRLTDAKKWAVHK
ncbi:MAG: hypothetical protein ACRDFB_01595 [Rhabdochlamydiaceae bacterium]